MPPVKFRGTPTNAKHIPTQQGFRLASAETRRALKYKAKRKSVKRLSLKRPWDVRKGRKNFRGVRNEDGTVTFTV